MNSCGDADKIVTPRDIDTLLKPQLTIIKTVNIPTEQVFIYFNGTNQRLFSAQGNNIEAVQYSDLSWGVRLNLFVSSNSQQSLLDIDSLSIRATSLKVGDMPVILENTISSGKNNASRIVLRRPGANNVVIEPAFYSDILNAPTIVCTKTNNSLEVNLHYSSNGINAIESQIGQSIGIVMEIKTEVQ